MPPQDTDTPTADQIRAEVEALVLSFAILQTVYEPTLSIDVPALDSPLYAAGVRAGARLAYADSVRQAQGLRAKLQDLLRAGAVA